MKTDKKKQGKKNKEAGRRFELKVRKDLESKGWIVSKWMNNVEFMNECDSVKNINGKLKTVHEKYNGKLIPAKHKFRGVGIPMAIGTGFPDFIAFRLKIIKKSHLEYEVIGVESKGGDKSHKYLSKEEKEKCDWLLKNKIFSKILIANKGKKRGEIIYEDYI